LKKEKKRRREEEVEEREEVITRLDILEIRFPNNLPLEWLIPEGGGMGDKRWSFEGDRIRFLNPKRVITFSILNTPTRTAF